MYFISACPSFFSLPHPLFKHEGEDQLEKYCDEN